jgi:hypothetical protein
MGLHALNYTAGAPINNIGWIKIIDPAYVTIVRAGDADPGSRLRRRRREVALANIIPEPGFGYLTSTLRLPYAFQRTNTDQFS